MTQFFRFNGNRLFRLDGLDQLKALIAAAKTSFQGVADVAVQAATAAAAAAMASAAQADARAADLLRDGGITSFDIIRRSFSGMPFTVTRNVLTFDQAEMYGFDRAGATVLVYKGPVPTAPERFTASFTCVQDDVILLDLTTAPYTVLKQGVAVPRPAKYALLTTFTDGKFVGGLLEPYISQTRTSLFQIPSSADARWTYLGGQPGQSATQTGSRVTVLDNSPDNNTGLGNAHFYDKDTFENLGYFTHNFGHAGSLDYDAARDMLAIGNGNSAAGLIGRVDFIRNWSSYQGGVSIAYKDASTPQFNLEFSKYSGATLVDTLAPVGSGVSFCFGETTDVGYLIGPTDGYKVLIGRGSNDLSDTTAGQTDRTRWGTFVAGRGDGDPNGTALIMNTYGGMNLGTIQDYCFHAGFLYVAVSRTTRILEVLKVQLVNGNTWQVVGRFQRLSFTPAGGQQDVEAEGVFVRDGTSLVAGGIGVGFGYWPLH